MKDVEADLGGDRGRSGGQRNSQCVDPSSSTDSKHRTWPMWQRHSRQQCCLIFRTFEMQNTPRRLRRRPSSPMREVERSDILGEIPDGGIASSAHLSRDPPFPLPSAALQRIDPSALVDFLPTLFKLDFQPHACGRATSRKLEPKNVLTAAPARRSRRRWKRRTSWERGWAGRPFWRRTRGSSQRRRQREIQEGKYPRSGEIHGQADYCQVYWRP